MNSNYKDHIAFINHNRPLPPVTIEDLNNQTVFTDRQYMNDELKDMFFKLDLIQSYGSGIRRAKRAMEENGSPKLVFSPNNDIDDYTLAVAYIIRAEINAGNLPQTGDAQNPLLYAVIALISVAGIGLFRKRME